MEGDPRRIDPEDMAAIVAALEKVAVAAEPTAPERAEGGADWTLSLRWLQQGPVSADTEAVLPTVLTEIRRHYTDRGRTPPARLELRGPEGEPLLGIGPEPS